MPAKLFFGRSAVAKKKDVSMADAANALRGYARQGANVHPQSEEQRKAYIALRDTHPRCTADQFMKYLESLKTKVSQGSRARQEFWAVPKANFPDGLPDHIQEYAKDEDECEGFMVDVKFYYVVDQFISRRELYGGVFPVEKYLQSELTGTLTGAAASSTGKRPAALLAPDSPDEDDEPVVKR